MASVTGPPDLAYLPIKAVTWPQDALEPPNGYGGMTRIDFNNEQNVGQQGYVYGAGSITLPTATVTPHLIQIQPDADFWCNQIVFQLQETVATSTSPRVWIKDTRTGYELAYPYGRLHNFENKGSFNVAGIPQSDRLPATLPTPYCFTRKGGILITVDNQTGGTLHLFASFFGWKEFANVSR